MNIFRRKGAKIFFAIFVCFFIGIFGYGLFNNLSGTNIAEVGDERIRLSEYLSAYENASRTEGRGNRQQLDYLKVRTLNQLIGSSIIRQEAKKAGLTVTDAEVSDAIQGIEAFESEEGGFDISAYQQFLRNNNFSASDYENSVKRNILYNKYINLFFPVTEVTPAMENHFKSWHARIANVRYFAVPNNLWQKEVTTDRNQLLSFYQQENNRYNKPTVFDVSFFYVPKDKVETKVSDAEIESYLKNRKEDFISKPQFKSRHILFRLEDLDKQQQVKEKANEIYQELLKDKTQFPALALEHSEDPVSKEASGDLGWVEYGNFVEEFEDVIKELEVGEISEPFISPYGYHIVLLEGKKEEEFNEQEAKETVKELFLLRKWQNYLTLIAGKVREAEDNLSTPEQMQALAEEYDIVFEENFLIEEYSEYQDVALLEIYQNLLEQFRENPQIEKYNNSYDAEEGTFYYQLISPIVGEKIPFEDIEQRVELDLKALILDQQRNTQIQNYNNQYPDKAKFLEVAKSWKIANVLDASFQFNQYIDREEQELNFSLKENAFQIGAEKTRFFQSQGKIYALLLDRISLSEGDSELYLPRHLNNENLEVFRSNILVNKFISQRLRENIVSYNNTLLEQYEIPINR